jgi:hypothetical protein
MLFSLVVPLNPNTNIFLRTSAHPLILNLISRPMHLETNIILHFMAYPLTLMQIQIHYQNLSNQVQFQVET